MKILLTNYMETTAPGGINKTVKEIAKNLSRKGHEVTVLQSNPLGLPKEEIYEGFKIVRVSSSFEKHFYGLSPEMYRYLKNHFEKLDPDIVHVHGYHKLLSAEIIHIIRKLNSEVPIIFSFHLDVVRTNFAGKYLFHVYNLLSRHVFKKSSHIISFSKFEKSTIINALGVDSSKISIIPHGVDLINLTKTKKENKIRLLYCGYLIDRKGLDFILKSLKVLVYDLGIKDVVLTVVGEGPRSKKFLSLSKDLKLDKYIIWKHFLPRKRLIKEIKKADIFLLLSRSEAYGIIVAEALSLGTPCIITKRTALTEFLDEPGCFGVDYPPDPEEVADLIIKIYKNDISVGPFSKRIRTWGTVAEEYEKLYFKLVENGAI